VPPPRPFRRKSNEHQPPAERSQSPDAAPRADHGRTPHKTPAVTPGLVAFDHRVHAFRDGETVAVCGAGPRLSSVGGGFLAGAAGYCADCSAR
jgi:hypothetical protein